MNHQAVGVHVKLGGAMVQYAPPDNKPGSKHVIELDQETTIQDLLDKLRVPVEQPLMVILNDAMVARPDYATTVLTNGDALALMPPIKAG